MIDGNRSASLTTDTDMTPHKSVDFFFDPVCPWTWLTSRWLIQVAESEGLTIRWRSFSLTLANEGGEVPSEFQTRMRESSKALRIIEALRASDQNEQAGRFYSVYGRNAHTLGEDVTDGFTENVAQEAELDPAVIAAAGDPEWDSVVRRSLAEARALVGEDVGSPVVAPSGADAFFGPIVDRPLPLGESLELWQALQTLAGLPHFFELKRTRTGPPRVQTPA